MVSLGIQVGHIKIDKQDVFYEHMVWI